EFVADELFRLHQARTDGISERAIPHPKDADSKHSYQDDNDNGLHRDYCSADKFHGHSCLWPICNHFKPCPSPSPSSGLSHASPARGIPLLSSAARASVVRAGQSPARESVARSAPPGVPRACARATERFEI